MILFWGTVRASKAARRASWSRTRSSAAFQRASSSVATRRMLGIHALVAAGGELRLIARLFDFEVQRLAVLTMPLVRPLRRGERGVDACGGSIACRSCWLTASSTALPEKDTHAARPSGDGDADSETPGSRWPGRCN